MKVLVFGEKKMKKSIYLVLFAAFCMMCAASLNAQTNSPDNLLTENSAGKVRLGMTVAEARKALPPGLKLERTSDGEGAVLIAVNQGEETIMTLYAGEEDIDSKIDEAAVIEFIEVWSKDFQTAEGVKPGMKVVEVEGKYGKVKEIFLSEIEAREFADFANQPKGLQFRLLSEDSTAGNYKDGESRTTQYTPDAYLFSIQVIGLRGISADETADEKSSGDSYKTIDVADFNKKIAEAAAKNEEWVKFPTQVIARWLPPFEEFGSRNIEMNSEFADVTDFLKVVVTDDQYADDSVRGERYWVEIKKDAKGVWQIVSAKRAWICRQNRGHQDYSIEPCL